MSIIHLLKDRSIISRQFKLPFIEILLTSIDLYQHTNMLEISVFYVIQTITLIFALFIIVIVNKHNTNVAMVVGIVIFLLMECLIFVMIFYEKYENKNNILNELYYIIRLG